MRGFAGFTKRNLLIYFKDVQSVIFSLLTSIIVLVLYLLFLKGTFVDAINRVSEGLEDILVPADVEMLVNALLLVGILGSAMITVPYNCLSTIVRDREQKIDYDISATPLKRWQIILSYFLASTLSAFVMTGVILTAGLGLLSALGDLHMSARMLLAAYGIVLLGAVSSTAFFMLVILFFKSTSASGAFSGMLSAAAGFIIGAYIPLSEFSEGVQTFCNVFPASHITILFRNVLLGGLFDEIDAALGGIDGGLFVRSFREIFSFEARLFGHSMNPANMLGYVAGFTVVCIVAMVLVYSKTYKRR